MTNKIEYLRMLLSSMDRHNSDINGIIDGTDSLKDIDIGILAPYLISVVDTKDLIVQKLLKLLTLEVQGATPPDEIDILNGEIKDLTSNLDKYAVSVMVLKGIINKYEDEK